MRAGKNNQSIAIVSVPSEVRKDQAGKLRDPAPFKASTESLAKRLAARGNVKVQTFSTLGKANLEDVLQEVARQTNNDVQKLYLMLHGNDQEVELHNGRSMGPEAFADTLISGLDWKNKLIHYLNTSKPVAGVAHKVSPLVLNLRLLACLTGWQADAQGGQNPQSFALHMLNHMAQWLKGEVSDFCSSAELSNSEKKQWQFDIEVRIKAPRGWNVVLQDGHNISYWVPDSQAGRVDRHFARKFDTIHSKREAHQKLGSVMLPEEEKSQVNVLSVSKYANQRVQVDILTR